MPLLRRLAIGLVLCSLFVLPTRPVSQTPAASASNSPTSWFQGWPMIGHDPQRTNRSPTIGPTHPHLLFKLKGVSIAFVGPDGTLYGVLRRGRPIALNPHGHRLWSPASCAGLPCTHLWVVGVSPQGQLLGIVQDREGSAALAYSTTGQLQWKIEPLGPVKGGTPLITDTGQFYFELAHSENDKVCEGVTELNADDAHLVRCVHVNLESMASDGRFYAISWSSLQAYSADGTALWMTPVQGTGRDPFHPVSKPDSIHPSFAVIGEDGTIYVGIGKQLAAIDPAGRLLWQVGKADQAMALALRSDGVILAAGRKWLDAVSQDGKKLWSDPIGRPGLERPQLVTDAAGTAYVGTADGKVRIFSSGGALLQTRSVGHESRWSPGIVVADGKLIVNGTDGTLRVYAAPRAPAGVAPGSTPPPAPAVTGTVLPSSSGPSLCIVQSPGGVSGSPPPPPTLVPCSAPPTPTPSPWRVPAGGYQFRSPPVFASDSASRQARAVRARTPVKRPRMKQSFRKPIEKQEWHSASAEAKLTIAVSSIADHPGGVVTVRSSFNQQLTSWTISRPGQTLFLPPGAVVHLSETPVSACDCLFRWTLSGNNGTFHRRLLTKQRTSFRIVAATRVAAQYIKVSGDISLVPTRPDAVLQPLPASEARVSPFVALDAAKAAWGLTDQQVDPRVGIVRALFSFKNDALHQNIRAWIVVANMATYCPAPGCNTVYSKMVIVVDAETGKALFSYPTDPAPTMGPPPAATPPPLGVSSPGTTPPIPTSTPPATPTPGTFSTSTGSSPVPSPTPATQPLQSRPHIATDDMKQGQEGKR